MMVVRLVILAVLFYIAVVLVRALTGRKKTAVQDRSEGRANSGSNVQDTLIEDPVCHRLVPKHQAVRLRQDGQTYYFCSDECCDTFIETPRGEQ